MPNSPVAGLPYPATSDAPAGPTQIQALTTALDSVVLARFATTALRDSTITAPINGQVVQCLDSGLWEYVTGTGWVTTGVRTVTTKVSTQNITSTGPTGLVLGIDNTTFTSTRRRAYRATASGIVNGDAVADLWRLYFTVDGALRIDIRHNVTTIGGPGAAYDQWPSFLFTLAAGTHTIGCGLTRISGSGTITLLTGATIVITDEGPA
jgi:hypothetical protein